MVNSVVKALHALDELTFRDSGEGLALSELSRRTEIPSNTLHSLLQTLIHCGYAEQRPDGRYAAGPKTRGLPIEPVLDVLADALDENIVFYTLVDGDCFQLYHRQSSNVIRVAGEPDGDDHFFARATTRVLGAFATSGERDRILERHGLPGRAWDGIRSRRRLDRALAEIRETGYLVTISHHGSLVNIAVPVLRGTRLTGVVGCYAPSFRCNASRQREVIGALKAAARECAQL